MADWEVVSSEDTPGSAPHCTAALIPKRGMETYAGKLSIHILVDF